MRFQTEKAFRGALEMAVPAVSLKKPAETAGSNKPNHALRDLSNRPFSLKQFTLDHTL